MTPLRTRHRRGPGQDPRRERNHHRAQGRILGLPPDREHHSPGARGGRAQVLRPGVGLVLEIDVSGGGVRNELVSVTRAGSDGGTIRGFERRTTANAFVH